MLAIILNICAKTKQRKLRIKPLPARLVLVVASLFCSIVFSNYPARATEDTAARAQNLSRYWTDRLNSGTQLAQNCTAFSRQMCEEARTACVIVNRCSATQKSIGACGDPADCDGSYRVCMRTAGC